MTNIPRHVGQVAAADHGSVTLGEEQPIYDILGEDLGT